MIKDILEANDNVTHNQKELEVLKQYFPACFKSDGSFDITRFSEFLKDKVNITHEGYELKFLGKSYAKLLASLDTETVIVPDEDHNSLPENKNSQNIYISGDNLDALKHLLKSYSGKVKCIYIDPPYNTGSDGFVYKDKFEFKADELARKLSIGQEQAEKILDLTSKGSASHSAWMTFMYPRLQLARDMMTKDGVILISIDDYEQANLRLLCDEVFGEDNFIASLIWDLGTGTTAGHFTRGHEYVLVYCYDKLSLPNFANPEEGQLVVHGALKKISYKNPASVIEFPQGFEFDGKDAVFKNEIGDSEKEYILSDEMRFKDGKLVKPTKVKAGFAMRDQVLDFIAGKEVFDTKGQKVIKFYFNKSGILFYVKDKSVVNPRTVLSDIPSTKTASTELIKLMGGNYFSYPKPVLLLKYLFRLLTSKKDIVMDFFSGSGTAAQSVMELNLEDSGSRKYLLVQLPERILANSEAYQKGFRTVEQIGIDRIKRAANQIRKEHPDTKVDLGFKHYTLKDIEEKSLLDRIYDFTPDAIIPDTSISDSIGLNTILTTWLVSDGYGFNNNCKALELDNYTAYHCDNHLYLINSGLSSEAVKQLMDKYSNDADFIPQNVVIFGYNFNYVQTENLKTNFKILKDTEKNLKINLQIRY